MIAGTYLDREAVTIDVGKDNLWVAALLYGLTTTSMERQITVLSSLVTSSDEGGTKLPGCKSVIAMYSYLGPTSIHE